MFVQDVERPELPAIVCPVMQQVIRPNMVAMFRPQADARPIIEPEPSLLWLFHWHFKPLSPPQPFDTFVAHLPACVSQQGSNSTVAISTKLACQLDHVLDQAFFVSASTWQSTLCRSGLAQNTANFSLGYLEPATHMINSSPPTRRAQVPLSVASQSLPVSGITDAASFRINLSKVRSETARCKRLFSF